MPEAIPVVLAAGMAAVAGAALIRARRLVRCLELVALCSHELRGALTAMGLALGRLERAGGVNPARLAVLRDAYERARGVACDLETVRGALAGAPQQRPETFDLQRVVWSRRGAATCPNTGVHWFRF